MTNEFGLIFHHLGLAVETPSRAIKFLAGLDYSTGEVVLDKLQNVNLVYCSHSVMPDIELIYCTSVPGGPLDNILKSKTELIYHTCYVTSSLENTLKKIKDNGFRVIEISAPKPALLFNENLVSFYYISGFGIIEIIEKEEGISCHEV